MVADCTRLQVQNGGRLVQRHEAGLGRPIAVGVLERENELDRAGNSVPEWSAH